MSKLSSNEPESAIRFATAQKQCMMTWQVAVEAGSQVCGGKGYSLALLDSYGFPVPKGGVLSATVYQDLISVERYRRNIEEGVPFELSPSVKASIHDFLGGENLLSKPLAVRSSATSEDSPYASFAGIHNSVLHVCGANAVFQAITACFSSLWTEHARAYRRDRGITDDKLTCAVIICEMVEADSLAVDDPVGGVCFTADPLSGRRDLLVIEAASTPKSIASGAISGDRYLSRNLRGRLLSDSVPLQGYPSKAAVLEKVALTAQRIQWALGDGHDAFDIEWMFDGSELWVLQARPITALPTPGSPALTALPQTWSTANFAEVLPGVPCELSWSLMSNLLNAGSWELLKLAGYVAPDGTELARRFFGRGYFNVTLMQFVPLDAFGVAPVEVLNGLGGRFPLIDSELQSPTKEQAKERSARGFKMFKLLWGIDGKAGRFFSSHIEAMYAITLTPCSSQSDLLDVYERIQTDAGRFDELAGLSNAASSRWYVPLHTIFTKKFGDRSSELIGALTAGYGNVVSAQIGYAISDLADVAMKETERLNPRGVDVLKHWSELPQDSPLRKAVNSFLLRFGHRAYRELDLINPRWAEDPSPVFDMVRDILSQRKTGLHEDSRARAQSLRHGAEQEVKRKLPLMWPLIRWLVRGLQQAYSTKELSKSAYVAKLFAIRHLALETGRQLVSAGHLNDATDALQLTIFDILAFARGHWDGRGADRLLRSRKLRREEWEEQLASDCLTEDGLSVNPVTISETPEFGASNVWRGIAAAPGQAKGIARVLSRPEEGYRLSIGEVLISPSADPAWTPLFIRASAVVIETAGYLSHIAIIAREYGVPTVVNVPGIIAGIKDGEQVFIDGSLGIVERCDECRGVQ